MAIATIQAKQRKSHLYNLSGPPQGHTGHSFSQESLNSLPHQVVGKCMGQSENKNHNWLNLWKKMQQILLAAAWSKQDHLRKVRLQGKKKQLNCRKEQNSEARCRKELAEHSRLPQRLWWFPPCANDPKLSFPNHCFVFYMAALFTVW